MYWIQKPPLGTPINFNHPLSKDLVGYWLMNEGNGDKICDLTASGRTGISGAGTAAPTWVSDYHFLGSCLSFDGTPDYITLPSAILSNYSQPSSGCMWLMSTDVTADKTALMLYKDGNSYLRFYLPSATPGKFNVVYGNGTSNIGVTTGAAATTLANNIWYCVAYVYNGTSVSIYINGVSQPTVAGANSQSIANIIGARSTSLGGWLGSISSFMLWNRALSADEITRLYREPFCMFDKKELWVKSL